MSRDAAVALLADVDAWCARNDCLDTLIGRVLYRHPGFVPLMRKRLSLSAEKDGDVRAFLAENPNGWDGALPKCSGYGVTRPEKNERSRGQRALIEADEQLRAIRLHTEFYRARQSDGRPMPDFIDELLWLGLGCYEHNRRRDIAA